MEAAVAVQDICLRGAISGKQKTDKLSEQGVDFAPVGQQMPVAADHVFGLVADPAINEPLVDPLGGRIEQNECRNTWYPRTTCHFDLSNVCLKWQTA